MENKKFEIKEAINYGWGVLKENLGFFLIIGTIVLIVSLIPSVAKEIQKKTNSDSIKVAVNLISLLFQIIGILLELGLIKISLKLFKKEEVSVVDLFAQYHLFFKYLGALIIYSLIILGGTILFIVPGIIWGIKFRFFSYFIVEDENCGIIESLEKSAQITEGYKWDLFSFGIISAIIGLIGFLAFFVGILIAMPVITMATVFIYKRLSTVSNSSSPIIK